MTRADRMCGCSRWFAHRRRSYWVRGYGGRRVVLSNVDDYAAGEALAASSVPAHHRTLRARVLSGQPQLAPLERLATVRAAQLWDLERLTALQGGCERL